MSFKIHLPLLFILYLARCSTETHILTKKTLETIQNPVLNNGLLLDWGQVYLPSAWNYVFISQNRSKLIFEDAVADVRGQIQVYQNVHLKSPVQPQKWKERYLKSLKEELSLQWQYKQTNPQSIRYFIKGTKQVQIGASYGFTEPYDVFIGLIFTSKTVVELLCIGKTPHFKAHMISVIRNLKVFNSKKDKKNPLIWSRHGLKISSVPGWNWRPAIGKNIITWEHETEPLLVRIAYLDEVNAEEEGDFESISQKNISLLRIYLRKIKYRYTYNLISENKSNQSYKVFECLGLIKVKKNQPGRLIGLKVYYFQQNSRVYQAFFWYQQSKWKKQLDRKATEVLKAIFL